MTSWLEPKTNTLMLGGAVQLPRRRGEGHVPEPARLFPWEGTLLGPHPVAVGPSATAPGKGRPARGWGERGGDNRPSAASPGVPHRNPPSGVSVSHRSAGAPASGWCPDPRGARWGAGPFQLGWGRADLGLFPPLPSASVSHPRQRGGRPWPPEGGASAPALSFSILKQELFFL